MSFLHGGRPRRTLYARWTTPAPDPYHTGEDNTPRYRRADLGRSRGRARREPAPTSGRWLKGRDCSHDAEATLLKLLAHPTIASKEAIIRRYDHEVGAATVVKPLTGSGGP